MLEKNGFKVKVLDLINMNLSAGYNPFVYLKTDNDVQRLVTNLFRSTTPKGSQSSDPFWDTAASMLLMSLVFLLKYEAPEYEQNFDMVLELLRAGEVKVFNKSVLLIGTINKGSKVIIDGNLYVLGKICGDVEIKDRCNKIYCECIYNSLVKIGDIYQIYTSELYDQIIYLKEDKIINCNYRIGDNSNGKSNSSYIW